MSSMVIGSGAET